MKANLRRSAWLLLLFALLAPGLGWGRSLEGKVAVSLQGGGNWVWMQDVNRLIPDRHYVFIDSEPNEALAPVGSAFSGGVGAYFGLMRDWLVGFQVNAMLPFTEVRIGSTLNPDRVYTVDLGALEYGMGAKYAWLHDSSWLLTAGAEFVYLVLNNAGEVRKVRNASGLPGGMTATDRIDYHGSTLGFKVSGGADLYLWDFWSVGLQLGFRYARIGQVKGIDLEGRSYTLKNPDGSDFSLDYGGFFLVAGTTVWF